jgi:hypothetical protein
MHRLTRISLSRPLLMALALVGVTVALGAGLPRVRTEFGSRVLIGDDHPAIQRLDAFLERYGSGMPLYIAWACGEGRPCESVFDEASLRMAHDVTVRLSSEASVSKVWSPSNTPLFVPAEDGFAVRRLVEHDELAADHVDLGKIAVDDPTWVGNLVSADGRVGAIIVQPVASRASTDEEVVAAVFEATAPHQDFDFAYVGEAVGNIVGGRELAESMGVLIPFMVLVIAGVIFAQTGSWQCVVASLACVVLALAWTFGVLGWIDWPRDTVLELLAPFILVMGICDDNHFFSRYADELESTTGKRSREVRRGALERASRYVSTPCFFATATTVVALMSFATSDLDTFRRFGVMSAIGISACMLLTFTLLPLLLGWLPGEGIRATRTTQTWRRAMEAIARTGERRAVPILVLTVLLVSASMFSWLTYLRVDASREELFGEHSKILRWVRFFGERLRPSGGFEIDVALPGGVLIESPDVLDMIARFADVIDQVPDTGTAWSVIDLLERLNAMLNGGAEEFERIGSTPAANAELLEVVGFEDPELLGSWVSFDRRHLRISLDVGEQSFTSATRLSNALHMSVSSVLPESWVVEMTGQTPHTLEWVRDLQSTQRRTFPLSFTLVFLLVAIFLRSLPWSLAALAPPTVAALVCLGAMGATGLSLDVGRAMIAAVLMGIGVDDSIYILSRQRVLRRQGMPARDAFRSAFVESGRPVVISSLALSLGFMTLKASARGTVSGFGFSLSLSILMALATTLFVVPALAFTILPKAQEVSSLRSNPGARVIG